jgi:hypothetical protein
MKMSRLTLLATSVAALVLFCVVVPSAKAQTYIVNITSGSPTCAGNTGLLTINSTLDTFEFTSSGGCYFGGVGLAPVPGTTKTTYDYGPTGSGDCLTNCSDLATLGAGDTITFQGSDVGTCSTPTTCTTSASSYGFNLAIPGGGFETTLRLVRPFYCKVAPPVTTKPSLSNSTTQR